MLLPYNIRSLGITFVFVLLLYFPSTEADADSRKQGRYPTIVRPADIPLLLIANGNRLHALEDYHTALQWYMAAVPYTIIYPDIRQPVFNGLAIVFTETGRYEEAVSCYLKALEYINEFKDEHAKAELYTNLAILFSKIKDNKKAEIYNEKAIRIFKSHQDPEWLTRALGKKAALLRDGGELNKAAEVYTEAYEAIAPIVINKDNPGTRDVSVIKLKNGILNNIADIYLRKKEPDKALVYLEKMNADTLFLPLYFRTARTISIGEALSHKGQYREAAVQIENGLTFAIQNQFDDLRLACHKELSTIYSYLGNFEKAWKHESDYMQLRENQFAETERKIHSVNSLESRYYLARKDKEIAEKQLRINKQAGNIREKNLWVSIMVTGLIFLVSILLVSRKNYQHRQKLLQEKLSNEEKTRRIMLAEATVKGEEQERERIAKELHDSIASEVLAMKLNLETMAAGNGKLSSNPEYRNILSQSAEIAEKIRRTAHNLMPARIQKQGLYAAVTAFINRISGPKIQFTFQHYGDLPQLKADVEKIILHITLELIQNIIKHARASEAMIQFHYFDGTLGITVEDNGIGINMKQIHMHKGIGWSNLEHNISILQGSIDIQSNEYTGTTVFIEIPTTGLTLPVSEEEITA